MWYAKASSRNSTLREWDPLLLFPIEESSDETSPYYRPPILPFELPENAWFFRESQRLRRAGDAAKIALLPWKNNACHLDSFLMAYLVALVVSTARFFLGRPARDDSKLAARINVNIPMHSCPECCAVDFLSGKPIVDTLDLLQIVYNKGTEAQNYVSLWRDCYARTYNCGEGKTCDFAEPATWSNPWETAISSTKEKEEVHFLCRRTAVGQCKAGHRYFSQTYLSRIECDMASEFGGVARLTVAEQIAALPNKAAFQHFVHLSADRIFVPRRECSVGNCREKVDRHLRMLIELPSVLIVHQNDLANVLEPPRSLSFQYTEWTLMAVNLWNPKSVHYTANLKIGDRWFRYDDMRENGVATVLPRGPDYGPFRWITNPDEYDASHIADQIRSEDVWIPTTFYYAQKQEYVTVPWFEPFDFEFGKEDVRPQKKAVPKPARSKPIRKHSLGSRSRPISI